MLNFTFPSGAGLLLTLVLSTAAFDADKTRNRNFQSVTVKITDKGYAPKSLTLKTGVPARVTFVRATSKSCGTELSIPEFGISKPLPLNKPVTVEFTPRKTGEFKFTCGMDMLRGKIIVQ